MQADFGRMGTGEAERFKYMKQPGNAEHKRGMRLSRRTRRRHVHAGYKERQSDGKTRDRAGDPDIKKTAGPVNGGSNPNERSDRPEQCRRWSKEWQRCRDAPSAAREVMPKLMGEKDQNERNGISTAGQEAGICMKKQSVA